MPEASTQASQADVATVGRGMLDAVLRVPGKGMQGLNTTQKHKDQNVISCIVYGA